MRINIYPQRKKDRYVIYGESWEEVIKEMNGRIYVFVKDYLKEKFKDNKLASMNMDNTFYPPLSVDVDSSNKVINEELL